MSLRSGHEASVARSRGESPAFGSHPILRRFLAVLAAGMLLAQALPVLGVVVTATGNTGTWSGDGPGTTQTVHNGTGGLAEFQYSLDPAGLSETRTWTFKATATSAGTIPLTWRLTGFHGFFDVRVGLETFTKPVRRLGGLLVGPHRRPAELLHRAIGRLRLRRSDQRHRPGRRRVRIPDQRQQLRHHERPPGHPQGRPQYRGERGFRAAPGRQHRVVRHRPRRIDPARALVGRVRIGRPHRRVLGC